MKQVFNFWILFFIFCFLFLGLVNSFAQKREIKGIVKNNKNETIPFASVAIKNASETVLNYSRTNGDGKYSINLPDSLSAAPLYIEANYIGFKKLRTQLTSNQDIYNFVLVEEAIEIKEVQVKARPLIIEKGDTLSYNVTSFSRTEDRSIGDVLKRLPGISVDESGKISHNGTPISNLYIQGDDLMDGRYGLATKAINKDMIKSIDVIERFQPIEVLKDKVFSDKVAVNLILKDENSLNLAGQAMLGGGFPAQYDAALNAMLFNKKTKILNSIKANNSGVDLTSDFSQLGTAGFRSRIENPNPSNILSLGTVGNPDLPKIDYYLNNAQLLNSNNLVNLKSGLQLKSNVQVYFDKNKLDYFNSLDNYLNSDTISYRETQRLFNKPLSSNAALTATANKKNYFFNNRLSFSLTDNTSKGFLNFNTEGFNQKIHERSLNLSNDFSLMPALKNSKNVVDLRWSIGYFNNPQTLNLYAGINADFLNQNIPYSSSIQKASTPTFYNQATFGYLIQSENLIKQKYEIGLVNERQEFNSILNLIQTDNTTIKYQGDPGNKVKWEKDRIFATANYTILKNKWRAGLLVPLIAQSIRYKQIEYQLDEQKNQILLNPNFYFTLDLNDEDRLNLNYQINHNIAEISNVYRGAVLTNYRTINANNTELQEREGSNMNISYNFKRSIIMLFANIRAGYSKLSSNTIASTIFSDNIQRSILLPFKNNRRSYSLETDLSKFIFALNTTFSTSIGVQNGTFDQLINHQIYPFNSRSLTIQTKIDSKLFNLITLSYSGARSWFESIQKPTAGYNGQINGKSQRMTQNILLGYTPTSTVFLNISGRHTFGKQSNNLSKINYLFLDANTRLKLTKLRTDIDFTLSNIANIKNYEVFSITSNQYFISSYNIRGRMAILRATFNL